MSRLHIDSLELDLRGIAPATAEAAARLLGPALVLALAQAQALVQAREGAGAAPRSAMQIDAGRLSTTANAEPQALATQMAGRIAARIHGAGQP